MPERTCVACRRRAPQAQLLRLRAVAGGPAAGRGPGRGAYVCRDRRCLRRAVDRAALARALRVSVRFAKSAAALDPGLAGLDRPSRGTGD
jgi:predicted RNA-binding protein YlxR (DUF448 family)